MSTKELGIIIAFFYTIPNTHNIALQFIEMHIYNVLQVKNKFAFLSNALALSKSSKFITPTFTHNTGVRDTT
jgi:hypothetical protein